MGESGPLGVILSLYSQIKHLGGPRVTVRKPQDPKLEGKFTQLLKIDQVLMERRLFPRGVMPPRERPVASRCL